MQIDPLMKRFYFRASVLALGVFLMVVSAQDSPDSVRRGSLRFQKKVVVTGLKGPWEITWGPDNVLWVTERIGKRVTRVDPATGERRVAITISEAVAPGGQDGVLGMALHPELLKGTGNDFVYVAYTYLDRSKADPDVKDRASPYRYLYGKIVRLRYNAEKQTLFDPVDVITGLPAGDDHNGGRLKFGPENKLYFTTGDQGHNQFGNCCLLIESQRLPTQKEIDAGDYASYVGKTLRINLDGSVPADNPRLNGVVSHVFTYGHRNPQGLDPAPNGVIYSSEHGPKTDDEINVLTPGGNYGWPRVAGLKDDKAYVYARWADSRTPCSKLKYDDLAIPASVPREPESAFQESFANPLATMFTVPTGFNFADPACNGADFICWPTVGVSSVEYYESKAGGIPGWGHVLLVSTLKRGSLYVLPLTPDGKTAAGHFWRYFQSSNRFRDTAASPDGRTIYLATDSNGMATSNDAGTISELENPGAIVAYTYTEQAGPEPSGSVVTEAKPAPRAPIVGGAPPQFTAAQATSGKTAYNSKCAVCHGTTMINGAYGTPLAGTYFKNKWTHQSVGALYESVRKMPPAAPGSLPAGTYAEIVAYILKVNGFQAGQAPLKANGGGLDKMVLE